MADERVALVTGGAKRVGRAIVERLAAAGYDIAFTYLRSSAEAEELTGRLKQKGRRAIGIQADLTDPMTAASVIESTVRQTFGRLDVLVNNASLYEPSPLTKTDLSQMRRLWAIHV